MATLAYPANLQTAQTNFALDYGIMISGERVMELDDCKLTLKPGDIVIDVGAWHLWDSSAQGCLMAFDMFDAEFADDGGTAVGNDRS